jgi:hypothetical protein
MKLLSMSQIYYKVKFLLFSNMSFHFLFVNTDCISNDHTLNVNVYTPNDGSSKRPYLEATVPRKGQNQPYVWKMSYCMRHILYRYV